MHVPASVSPPLVLCLSGHDPTGGAGIQADVETLSAIGCRACTVVTALTRQDTCDVHELWPQQAEDFLAQARLLIADLPIAGVKIGLLGTSEIAHATARLLDELPNLPVVLDPILAAGGGRNLARADLIAAIQSQLLPLTTVLTPNTPEARKLAGGPENPEDCAAELLRLGCGHVLITGTHEDSETVVNRLFRPGATKSWSWPRLPHDYHGSGCTLASALAGFLALGMDLDSAAGAAQDFTWRALAAGRRLGKGQYLPDRIKALSRN